MPEVMENATSDWRIQLGAFTQADQAREAWRELKVALVPRGLELAMVKSGALMMLSAGPLGSKAEASRICNELEAAGHACVVLAPVFDKRGKIQ
jgi:cell division septation protein DedD